MLKINKFNKIIVANWKLNGNFDFINSYFKDLYSNTSFNTNNCGVICPPSIYLQSCFSTNTTSFFLGAQDCSNFNSGAYTGEVSASMLKDNNCEFCIVGHSERRKIFNQSDEEVRIKAENLINNDIIPIICIGETLKEKDNGFTKDILHKQLLNSLPIINSLETIVIAYEPIWAIGSGLTPSLEEIHNIHSFIKKDIENFRFSKILYGGSVKSSNAQEILNIENVDGVLVGGSSLDPLEFIKILNS